MTTGPHDIEEDLSAWLDGELPPEEAAHIAAAVQEDPRLARHVATLRRTRDAVRRQGPVTAPRGFVDGVLDRLDEEPRRGRGRPLGIPWEGWALAAAALLVMWLALPGPDATPSQASRPESAPLAEGAGDGPAVVFTATTWRLRTSTPPEELSAIVSAGGGRLIREDETWTIRVRAEHLVALRSRLAGLGTLEELGPHETVVGRARITLELP